MTTVLWIIAAIVIVNILLVTFWYFFRYKKEEPSVESIELDKLYVCIKESDLLRCKIGKLYRFSRESYDAQDANGYDVLDKDYHIYQGECVSLEYIQEHFRLAIEDEIPKDEPVKPVSEPKFKAGDWMVYEENIYQIHNISLKKYYECLRTDGTVHTFDFEYIDSKTHMWTIQDAKDGDVLHCWIDGDEFVLIYKGVKDGYITTYGHLYQRFKLFAEEPTTMFCRTIQGHFTPATKEQRDLLFSKMAEAGYTWDAETKTLSKIEEPAPEPEPTPEPVGIEDIIQQKFDDIIAYFSNIIPIGEKTRDYLLGFKSIQAIEECFPSIYDYYGDNTNKYVAEQYLGWIVGLVLAELVPEKRQQLIQMAYDYKVKGAEQPTYGWTMESDPNIARMVAAANYAMNRNPELIPELRKEVGGKMLTYKNDISEFYIDTTKFMPTAPPPFIKGYEKRPKGTPVYADNTASMDEHINDHVAQYYNLDTKDAEKRQQTIQAIANKEYHKQHLFGKDRTVTDKVYGTMTIHPVFGKHNLGIEIPDDGAIANLVYDMGKICSATRISLLNQEYGRKRPGMGDTDGSMNPDERHRALVNYPIEEGDGHTTGYYDKGGYYVDGNGNYIGDYNTYYQGQLYANSYPSGHSAFIMGVGMLLMEVMPDKADLILKALVEFANSRVICRYHNQSDVTYGLIIGSMMIPVLHATTNYDLDGMVNNAKEEYQRILSGDVTPEPTPIPSDEKVNTSLAYFISGYGSCHVDAGETAMVHRCTKQCTKERHPAIQVNQRVEFTIEGGGVTDDNGKTSGVWEANTAYGIKCPAVKEDQIATITMRNENGVRVLQYRLSKDGTHDDGTN